MCSASVLRFAGVIADLCRIDKDRLKEVQDFLDADFLSWGWCFTVVEGNKSSIADDQQSLSSLWLLGL
jgi:hypothetical protein